MYNNVNHFKVIYIHALFEGERFSMRGFTSELRSFFACRSSKLLRSFKGLETIH